MARRWHNNSLGDRKQRQQYNNNHKRNHEAKEHGQTGTRIHSQTTGAGAAGGLGYAFLQYLHAESMSGILLLLETIQFKEMVKDADLIITGEGSADRQTLMGKLPVGILEQSGKVPVFLIAGRISDREELLNAGFARVECINPPGISLEEAMKKHVAQQNIQECVADMVKKN